MGIDGSDLAVRQHLTMHALFREAGEEAAEDELEGIIVLRATAQVGEGVGDGGPVAAS